MGPVKRPRPPRARRPRTATVTVPAVLALVAVVLAGCSGTSAAVPRPAGGQQTNASSSSAPPSAASPSVAAPSTAPVSVTSASDAVPAGISKVLVIAEENETYRSVLGHGSAPYLDSVAKQFGTATAMDAGYPPSCPSLAAYLLMTSGDRYGVCDDAYPSAHRIRADNVFHQVAASGRTWRNYAESMPAPCTPRNSGHFLVRHAPAVYYVSEASRCKQGMVPLGSLTSGALHDDVVAGTLPAYGFVTPDECNDMHGGRGCRGSNLVTVGDTWLRRWMAQIMAGPDYRAGRLAVLITWDEGDARSNHIPLLAVSPGTRHVTITRPVTQCHLLRTVEELLGLTPLGCAARATSMAGEFGLSQPGR